MGEEYIIETKRLKDGEIESRAYRGVVGKSKTRCEIDPKDLIPIYRKFYINIIKAHTQIIKQGNLEKVVTTFEP